MKYTSQLFRKKNESNLRIFHDAIHHIHMQRIHWWYPCSSDNRINGECGIVSWYRAWNDELRVRAAESPPRRNSVLLQKRLIAMGHAYGELIIKIKYCSERVTSPLFYSTTRSSRTEQAGRRRHATPTAAVVLRFPTPQAVIYIIKHTWLICWKMLRLTPTFTISSFPFSPYPKPYAHSLALLRGHLLPSCDLVAIAPNQDTVTHYAWYPADTGVSCVRGFFKLLFPFSFFSLFLFLQSVHSGNFDHEPAILFCRSREPFLTVYILYISSFNTSCGRSLA